ncbi:putative fk506-binding protein 2 precursor [Diplogelasinospora grovesii]|uniref:Fk506-binding protein 2 n=1 Tax=Diplogelasinospora grovesii TaxID=303347 RepID=A0AAN6NEH7_9PEZI|nr:putative fk506-binding protein 2 precursor [Diplogelasinospora grovesii]
MIAQGGPKDHDNGPTECRLLGSFAILVQLALGALALLSLVYKRWRERPQRPVKIWFFDVSKQVFGSVLVHIANVFMSMLTSGRFSIKVDPATITTRSAGIVMAALARRHPHGDGGPPPGEEGYMPNPCSFYLLNLAIDTTLGIPILIVLLRLMTKVITYTSFGKPAESVQSGNYGHQPNAWWWLKQSLIYFCGLMGMKICVLIIFMVFPWISRVGDWALGWTEGNEKLQIIFVMMLFPLIMNALQYYIIDSYIKKKAADDDDDVIESAPVAGGTGAAASPPGVVVYDELDVSDHESDDEEERPGLRRNRSSQRGAQGQMRYEWLTGGIPPRTESTIP